MTAHRIVLHHEWVEPLWVINGINMCRGAVALIAGAGDPQAHGGRWSYVGCEPDELLVVEQSDNPFDILDAAGWREGPVIGLASYDAGARVATGLRESIWPDIILGRYPSLLIFDHIEHRILAQGVASCADDARRYAEQALGWLGRAKPPAAPHTPSSDFKQDMPPEQYAFAVSQVVRRIGEGELFQANIARGWSGQLLKDRDPFDVLLGLSQDRGAAYGAFWRMDERALVSNSPELFLSYEAATRRLETRPIKGTRPRGFDHAHDCAMAEELAASAKDRAENLMIVDLMRNDLARVSEAGSVTVETLCEVESHPTVHHLTSVVASQAMANVSAAQILAATFPPGSITGAPKHQAMKVIASLEPPRGAWCGTLFGSGLVQEGDLIASVLIRTASFERRDEVWNWSALAGAGITTDSDPLEETAETEAKISALRDALFTSGNPDS